GASTTDRTAQLTQLTQVAAALTATAGAKATGTVPATGAGIATRTPLPMAARTPTLAASPVGTPLGPHPVTVANADGTAISTLDLPTNDLISDARGDRLYASVPGEAGRLGNSV